MQKAGFLTTRLNQITDHSKAVLLFWFSVWLITDVIFSSNCNLSTWDFNSFPFGLEVRILVLIVLVPGHCIPLL